MSEYVAECCSLFSYLFSSILVSQNLREIHEPPKVYLSVYSNFCEIYIVWLRGKQWVFFHILDVEFSHIFFLMAPLFPQLH